MKPSEAMNSDLTTLSNVVLKPLALDVTQPLSLTEWRDIGRQFATAMRTVAFVIGDWLVYGEGRDGQLTLFADIPESDRVSKQHFHDAMRQTGLDITTLQHYAYVARHVPRSMRNEHVSWEYHRKVAKLRDDDEKRRWLALAAEMFLDGNPLTLLRFSRSIQAGRLMSAKELEAERADRGTENIHPYVNRIQAFFGRLRDSGWLRNAGEHKRAALKRDLQPIIDIYNQL